MNENSNAIPIRPAALSIEEIVAARNNGVRSVLAEVPVESGQPQNRVSGARRSRRRRARLNAGEPSRQQATQLQQATPSQAARRPVTVSGLAPAPDTARAQEVRDDHEVPPARVETERDAPMWSEPRTETARPIPEVASRAEVPMSKFVRPQERSDVGTVSIAPEYLLDSLIDLLQQVARAHRQHAAAVAEELAWRTEVAKLDARIIVVQAHLDAQSIPSSTRRYSDRYVEDARSSISARQPDDLDAWLRKDFG